jgi:hypothetical protein
MDSVTVALRTLVRKYPWGVYSCYAHIGSPQSC